MTKLEDWLETIPSKISRRNYFYAVKKFEDFYQKPIEDILKLESQEVEKIARKFLSWLKEKGYQLNSIRLYVSAITLFYKYFNGKQIKISLPRVVPALNVYRISLPEVRRMFKFADLRDRILLCFFIRGLRVYDVSQLKWKNFEDLLNKDIQDFPQELTILTTKEGIIMRTFIDKTLFELLKTYRVENKESTYLFQGKHGKPLSTKMLNNVIQRLGKRIGINGKLSFHCGRRLFARICVENGIPTYAMRFMMGKAIPTSDVPYVEGVDLTRYYEQLSSMLCLEEQTVNNKVGNLEEAIDLVLKALKKLIIQQGFNLQTTKEMSEKEFIEAFVNARILSIEDAEKRIQEIKKEKLA